MMTDPTPITLKGLNGTVTLTDDAVVLTFAGMSASKAQKNASPRAVPLGAIDDVEVTPPKGIKPGHLRLVVRGADGYAHDAGRDLNAVLLGVDARPHLEQFADATRAAAAEAVPVETFHTDAGSAPAPAYAPRPKAEPTLARTSAKFAGVKVRTDGTIHYRGEVRPLPGTAATVQTAGQLRERTTATRVAAGAILAGPLGAVLGGLFRKKIDDRTLFLTIEGDGYAWVVEVDIKEERQARQFAAALNVAGR